jgi:probable H4MPT-linked C1 transfer pathway protein
MPASPRPASSRPASSRPPVPVIGLDVGGANTKAAVVDGETVRIASEPFEVWRAPEALSDAIASVVEQLELERAPVALTTTAELVDVFASKRAGVLYVLEAARQALPGRRLRVLTTAGQLISLAEARATPLRCAAANWMATGLLVARSRREAILVDCGGTTTDVIPIVAGEVAARGRTDLERLLHGELVYTGALRTNVAAVLGQVPIGGEPCPVSSELFAISADAHLLRGSLTPEQCTCTFPDNRGTSLPEVRSRLARVVCADPEQLAAGDLEAVAAAVEESQTASIAAALQRVADRAPAGAPVVAIGVGAFLARAAAARCGVPLDSDLGPAGWDPLRGNGAVVAAAVALSVLGRD